MNKTTVGVKVVSSSEGFPADESAKSRAQQAWWRKESAVIQADPSLLPPASDVMIGPSQNMIFDNGIREPLLTLRELADQLRVSESGLRKLIKRERLPHYKVGQQLRFKWSVLEGHLQRRQ